MISQSEKERKSIWLTHEEYNRYLTILGRIITQFDNFETMHEEDQSRIQEVIKNVVLGEQFVTRRTIIQGGLSPTIEPQHIPGVNEVQNLKPFKKSRQKSFNITVTGMPCAGKDTLLKMIDELDKPGVVVTQEPYAGLKDWEAVPKEGTIERQQYILGAALGELFRGALLLKRESNDKGVIIHNRGYDDNTPFSKARLLTGDIKIKDYFDEDLGWVFRARINFDAIIFCLQPPSVSMARRREPEKPGRYLNPEFLQILYEQYLRTYCEMVKEGKANVVILDTSRSIEENLASLQRILSQLTRSTF